MPWSPMIDLSRSDEEKDEDMMPAMPTMPDYPSGCCIRLTERELEKLGLDTDIDVGDIIDLRAFGTVTAVHKAGESCCCEIQLERMAVENEMDEEMGDED